MFTRRKKHISALLLTLVMAFTMNSPFLKIYAEAAGAEETGELNTLKEQQEQLAEQKAEFQAEYSEISSELVSQMAKLEYLTSQLDMNSAEIENLSQQIVIYTNSIAEMENQLNSDKQKEQELLERFKARVRVMEENGSYTYLSILFGADSFENMLSRVECIREIMAYDNSIIEDVRETQEKVQAEKQEMESEMADLAILCSDFQEKREDLLVQQKAVEEVLGSLKADSEGYEEQISSVITLQTTLSEQIGDIEQELAELERIQAEQAAAVEAVSQGDDNQSGGSVGTAAGQDIADTGGTAAGQDIADFAETFLGVGYVYGGTSPSRFDCSGLVYYVYTHFGYSVNRTAAGLAYNGTAVSPSELQAGDVLLFTTSKEFYIGHTGIYIGDGQFIHATSSGSEVKISSLSDYADYYFGARRIIS